ncbi:BRO-N domain-containing protein [Rhodopila sp.]|uniref:BRO-N domain-containing protein n=1 Tax=Rhodopila sp. TaxID=2480087 RepID=UPI003D12B328
MTPDCLTPFIFEGDTIVRVKDIDGLYWFVAVDVCRALGLTNTAETMKALDNDEKGISTTDALGGRQEVIIISVSGLFALIGKSQKVEAKRFRRWVTSEVFPKIRQPGSYFTHSGIWAKKPFAEWSLEERRVNLSTVNTARITINPAAGIWMWEQVGFPVPPRHLLPAWWQGDLLG